MRVSRVMAAGLAAGIVSGLAGAPSGHAGQPPDGPMSSAGGQSADADRAAAAVERAVTGAPDTEADANTPAPAPAPGSSRAAQAHGVARRGKSVSFRRLLVALAPGQTWGEVDTGPFCVISRPLNWSATSAEMKTPQFIAAFRAKFLESGIAVATAAAPGAVLPTSVYNVYGLVTRLHGNFCLPHKADLDHAKGRVTLSIQWRLFTPLGREPIATVATTTDYRQKTLQPGGVEGMLDAAFNQDLDQFLEEPAVLQALAPGAAQGG